MGDGGCDLGNELGAAFESGLTGVSDTAPPDFALGVGQVIEMFAFGDALGGRRQGMVVRRLGHVYSEQVAGFCVFVENVPGRIAGDHARRCRKLAGA